MANSSVPITAGAGTNIDTFTPGSGDHRQVVVVGSPTTDANVAEVNAAGASLVNQPDVRLLSQSLTMTAGQAVTLSGLTGQGAAAIQTTGDWLGTIVFEGTVDGTTWSAIYPTPFGSAAPVSSATDDGMWQAPCAGLQGIRVRCSVTGTGTATVSLSASSAAPAWPSSSTTVSGIAPPTAGDYDVDMLTELRRISMILADISGTYPSDNELME